MTHVFCRLIVGLNLYKLPFKANHRPVQIYQHSVSFFTAEVLLPGVIPVRRPADVQGMSVGKKTPRGEPSYQMLCRLSYKAEPQVTKQWDTSLGLGLGIVVSNVSFDWSRFSYRPPYRMLEGLTINWEGLEVRGQGSNVDVSWFQLHSPFCAPPQ